MPDSVYKVIELVGTSTKSWEDAAKHDVLLCMKPATKLAWPCRLPHPPSALPWCVSGNGMKKSGIMRLKSSTLPDIKFSILTMRRGSVTTHWQNFFRMKSRRILSWNWSIFTGEKLTNWPPKSCFPASLIGNGRPLYC